jgi:hypothetical protein
MMTTFQNLIYCYQWHGHGVCRNSVSVYLRSRKRVPGGRPFYQQSTQAPNPCKNLTPNSPEFPGYSPGSSFSSATERFLKLRLFQMFSRGKHPELLNSFTYASPHPARSLVSNAGLLLLSVRTLLLSTKSQESKPFKIYEVQPAWE